MSWEQLLEWIQNNLAIAIIIAAVFILLIIILIALAVRVLNKKSVEKDTGDENESKKKTHNQRNPTKKKNVAKRAGKWTIEFKRDDEYIAKLSAANGEVMLTSEIYSTEAGARSGIETIIKCIESGHFIVYRDKGKNFYYKLKTASNRLICVGEIYTTRDKCEKAIESVKRIAVLSPVHDELIKGSKYVDYKPIKVGSYDIRKGSRGKWKIETTEEGKYCARLYAANGQLMLATEEMSLRRSALNAIEIVKNNSAKGNFIIDCDKFGRYYYKLRNSQKSIIYMGETYESLDSCISALETMRRYAATATLPGELR